MWISMFAVVLVIAVGLGWGSVALESFQEAKPARNLRRLRQR